MSEKLPTRLLASAVAILCCLTPLSAWSSAVSAAGINMKNRFMTQRNSSWVEFTVEALGIATAKGYFTTFGSTIFYDQENIGNSSVTFYVKADSLSMANGTLDQAFQSPALLDAAKHPRIVFQSRRIVPRKAGGFDMMGDLTVKGVSKEVTCRMEAPTAIVRDDQSNFDMVGFRGSMTIDRRDFGLSGIPQMDALFQGKPRVSNEVQISFSFAAFRYTLDYLQARFHGKAQHGSMHPVGTLYDLTRQKGIDAALNRFDKMKSETPDRIDKNTLPDLGWFLMVAGHPEEAIQAYQKSFEDHPEFWTAYMRMGDAYVLIGQKEKAIQTYTQMKEHFEFHPHLEELLRLLKR